RDVDQVGKRAHGHPAVSAQRLDDHPVGVVHCCHMSTQAVRRGVAESHMARLTAEDRQFFSSCVRPLEIWLPLDTLSWKEHIEGRARDTPPLPPRYGERRQPAAEREAPSADRSRWPAR